MYRHRPNFRRASILLAAFLSGGLLLAAEGRGESVSARLLDTLDSLDGANDDHISIGGFDVSLESSENGSPVKPHVSRASGDDWLDAFLPAAVAAMLANERSRPTVEEQQARWDTLKRHSRQQKRMTVRRMIKPPTGGGSRRGGAPTRENYLYNLKRPR